MLAIREELGLPVKLIGVGEQIDDLQPFDAQEFAEALFDRNDEDDEERRAADARIAAGRRFDEYGEEITDADYDGAMYDEYGNPVSEESP